MEGGSGITRRQRLQEKVSVLGLLFALVGGLIAVWFAIDITNNDSYLWGLLLLIPVLTASQGTGSRGTFLGLLAMLLQLFVGAVIFLRGNGNFLWGVLIVALLVLAVNNRTR